MNPLPKRWTDVRARILAKVRGEQSREALRAAGARIGAGTYIARGCYFDPDFLWLIDVGENATIAQDVALLAHDASTKRLLGYTIVGRVRIGSRVYIGRNTIVLPGVTVGDEAIVGCGSVIRHDVPAGTVVGGAPARRLCSTDEYVARHRALMSHRPHWPAEGWTAWAGAPPENREAMREALADGPGYVR